MLFVPMSKEDAKSFYNRIKKERDLQVSKGTPWYGLGILNDALNDLTFFTDNFTKDYGNYICN